MLTAKLTASAAEAAALYLGDIHGELGSFIYL